MAGSVADTDGLPIPTATVELRILSAHSLISIQEKPEKVDERGSFSYPALPQGRDYHIQGATAKGYGTAGGMVKTNDSMTDRYQFPTFVLKRANQVLAGKVVDADGNPLADAWVHFSGTGQLQFPSTRSDSKGHFVFDEVCEGDVQVFGFLEWRA